MSRPRSLSSRWMFLRAALLSLLHGLAAADPPRCGQDTQCRSHLDRGVSLDLARKYELALREFQAAYKHQPDPRVAVNIGRTLHKLGRFAEALSFYKEAGRMAPADTALQKQLQDFIGQAKQNLSPSQTPVSVVNQPTFTVQNSPVSLTPTATAINSNHFKLDFGPLVSSLQPVKAPQYKQASLWISVISLALATGAIGIAAATWPQAWQPDSQIPSSVFSAVKTGSAR